MLQLRFDDAVDYGLQLQLLAFHLDNLRCIWADVNYLRSRALLILTTFSVWFVSSRNDCNYKIINQMSRSHIVCWQQCCRRFSIFFQLSFAFVQMTVYYIFVFAAVPHSAREACDVRDSIKCHTHSAIGTIVAVENESVACQAQENVLQLPVTRYVCMGLGCLTQICTFFLCTQFVGCSNV